MDNAGGLSHLWGVSLSDSEDSDDEEELVAIAIARARSANAARGGGQGPQGPKRIDPSPFNWEHHLYMLSPADFKTHYRLSLEAFTDLVEMLRPMLEATDKKQAARTRRGEFIQEMLGRAMNNL